MLDFPLTFSHILVTGQDPNCTSIARAMFSTCCLYSLLSALDENQLPVLEAGALIGANDGGAFQGQSDNIQDAFDSLLNFGSNEYHYGLNGFAPPQPSSSLSVFGAPSSASSARSVLDITSLR
jgi:hypothetical protein